MGGVLLELGARSTRETGGGEVRSADAQTSAPPRHRGLSPQLPRGLSDAPAPAALAIAPPPFPRDLASPSAWPLPTGPPAATCPPGPCTPRCVLEADLVHAGPAGLPPWTEGPVSSLEPTGLSAGRAGRSRGRCAAPVRGACIRRVQGAGSGWGDLAPTLRPPATSPEGGPRGQRRAGPRSERPGGPGAQSWARGELGLGCPAPVPRGRGAARRL